LSIGPKPTGQENSIKGLGPEVLVAPAPPSEVTPIREVTPPPPPPIRRLWPADGMRTAMWRTLTTLTLWSFWDIHRPGATLASPDCASEKKGACRRVYIFFITTGVIRLIGDDRLPTQQIHKHS